MEQLDFASLKRRRDLRIILPVFLVSIIACIDRVNVAYAKLTMTQDLPWITPEVFGMGAGIFFIGYLLFEIPGSLVAAKFSATKWIARIMFTWGLVCVGMAFITTEFQFFLCRFLLGASEASLYPVIYSVLFPRWFTAGERSRATSLMLTSLLLSNIIGARSPAYCSKPPSSACTAGRNSSSSKPFPRWPLPCSSSSASRTARIRSAG